MTKKSRALALLMAMAMLFVMLSSASYLAENTGHDCAQESCPICQQIEACECTLREIVWVAVAAAIVLLLVSGDDSSRNSYFVSIPFPTPVSLKVKLSN